MKTILDLEGTIGQDNWSREDLVQELAISGETLSDFVVTDTQDNAGDCWNLNIMVCGCIVAQTSDGENEQTIQFSQHEDCKLSHDKRGLCLKLVSDEDEVEVL